MRFQRFLRDGGGLHVVNRSEFWPPGTSLREEPVAVEGRGYARPWICLGVVRRLRRAKLQSIPVNARYHRNPTLSL
jgi:hypothetical protein